MCGIPHLLRGIVCFESDSAEINHDEEHAEYLENYPWQRNEETLVFPFAKPLTEIPCTKSMVHKITALLESFFLYHRVLSLSLWKLSAAAVSLMRNRHSLTNC